MTDALNTPVRRPRREIHTSDFPVGQAPTIDMSGEGPIERGEIVTPLDGPLSMDQVEPLAFAEESVTILINPSAEKNAPLTVDCWVNGKGAEVFLNGKWQEFGWLPVNRPVTTKRKYVEVLARSKMDNVTTDVGSSEEERPRNNIVRNTSVKSQFSVLADSNKRGLGHEWLMRLMAER